MHEQTASDADRTLTAHFGVEPERQTCLVEPAQIGIGSQSISRPTIHVAWLEHPYSEFGCKAS